MPTKSQALEQALDDNKKYASSSDYPYNDSDGYIEKIEMLEPCLIRQKSNKAKSSEFDFIKYLRWMLIRSDQPISHYLTFSNESEAD